MALDRSRAAVAESRLARLRSGRRAQGPVVIWPGTEMRARLSVLSCSEVQECHAHAHVRFDDIKIPLTAYSLELFQDEVMTQILFLGCRDPEDPAKPFADSADDLRDNTTVDERAAVFELYQDFQSSVDPAPAEMSQELLADILDAVKKKDAMRLRAFGSVTLASFLLSTGAPQST